MTNRRVLAIIPMAIVFGLLMGLRGELGALWMQVGVAGLAFALLALTGRWISRGRPQR